MANTENEHWLLLLLHEEGKKYITQCQFFKEDATVMGFLRYFTHLCQQEREKEKS